MADVISSVTNGFAVFINIDGDFNIQGFLCVLTPSSLLPSPNHHHTHPPPSSLSTAYFGIALSLCIYFGWKLFKRPALRKATDMDLTSGLEEIDADEEYWKQNYQPPTTRWGKFVDWLL